MSDRLQTALDAFLDDLMEKEGLPGYDCAVWHDHREVFRHQKGYADMENRVPYTHDTLLHIYSNTKVVACVAALQLWEQGAFRLEDPISRFFPEMGAMQVRTADGALQPLARAIAIRDLFTMTAGIGNGDDYRDMAMRFYTETTGRCPLLELPRFLAATPLAFQPGARFCYGICHEVLAALVEKCSGQRFGAYLQAHVFAPLGMRNTAFDPAQCAAGTLAQQYSRQPDGTLKNEGSANILIPPILKESASGGLVSTVDDYMKFQEALCRENVLLKKETTDLMRTNQLAGGALAGYGYTRFGKGYGLGVRTVRDDQNPRRTGPYGWGGAAGTYGLIDPERALTIFYAQQVFGARDIQGDDSLAKVVYDSLGEF